MASPIPIGWRRPWLRHAGNDLDLAEMASRNGFHAQACFLATQAA